MTIRWTAAAASTAAATTGNESCEISPASRTGPGRRVIRFRAKRTCRRTREIPTRTKQCDPVGLPRPVVGGKSLSENRFQTQKTNFAFGRHRSVALSRGCRHRRAFKVLEKPIQNQKSSSSSTVNERNDTSRTIPYVFRASRDANIVSTLVGYGEKTPSHEIVQSLPYGISTSVQSLDVHSNNAVSFRHS